MTPAARHAAAIGILDRVIAGEAAEKALTNWGRGARFAGSGDRAAVRDLVFDALRCRRSFAALGGAETGRGLILGGLRARGAEVEAVFTGEGHAPPPLTDEERAGGRAPEGLEVLDCPDWLAPLLQASLGPDFALVMEALRHRAPVFLRVNLRKATREEAIASLAAEGIIAQPHPLSPAALEVTGGARKVQGARAFAAGLVEVQDAASQAVCDLIPVPAGAAVLDYCAGGGGKTLALAARAEGRWFAHDANPARMSDLRRRASRAGVDVTLLAVPADAAPFDVVLCDVPCSGSGAWRRAPEEKWRLSPEGLARLGQVQESILGAASRLVRPGGILAYATCSLLVEENADRVASFLERDAGWRRIGGRTFTLLDGGDGFFLAVLQRSAADAIQP